MDTFTLIRVRIIYDFFYGQMQSILYECIEFEENLKNNPTSIRSFRKAADEQWRRIEVLKFDFRIIRACAARFGNDVDKKDAAFYGERIKDRIDFMEK